MLERIKGIEFLRVNNDVNGNPRYVVHFSDLLYPIEYTNLSIEDGYKKAVKRANKIGGKKYRAKHYGGGIVFQSYNIHALADSINEIKKEYPI